MIHWFKDQHFRSLIKNTSYLGASRIVAAIGNVATLAFAARALGVLPFGTLVLITSYVRGVDGIAKFQSWQLIVRYGGHGVAHGDPEHFKIATGFAFALDMLTGIAGMVVGAALLPLIGSRVGISAEYLWLGMVYCTLLPIMNSATADGVLRVLDRFDLLSWADTVMPISRAMLAAAAFAAQAPLPVFVAIWYATDLVGALCLWWFGWRELRRSGHLRHIRPTLRPTPLAGAWRFAINVNFAASVEAVWGPLARVAVGGLLGPAGAALFRIASSLADAAQKPGELLGKAFYPEVVRMDLACSKPWRLMFRGSALLSAVALAAVLIMVLGGKPLMGLMFGKAFLGAYQPLMILMAIPFIGIVSFPLVPMLYALGQSWGPLRAKLLGSATLFLVISPLSWVCGVSGAAMALVLANLVNTAAMIGQLKIEHRRVRTGENPDLPPKPGLRRS